MIKRFLKFLKKYTYVTIAALVVVIAVIAFFALRGEKQVTAETITSAKTTIVQEVSVTGRVVPAQEVALAIQSGGKVTSLGAKVGDQVTAGQVLLRVDTADLQIRLGRQRAALEKAQLALERQDPAASAKADLEKAYEDGFNAITDSFIDIPTIISELHSMLYDSGHSPYLSDSYLRGTGGTAREDKDAVGVRFDRAEDTYEDLVKRYQGFTRNASDAEVEDMLATTHAFIKNVSDIVKDIRSLIKYVEDRTTDPQPEEIDRDQATLEGYTTDMNAHLSEISAIQTDIKDAQKGITDQTNNIQSSQIDIRQAELDIQDTLVQIANRTIVSPVDGIVTDIQVERGETISAGNPVISVISSNQYEIEANIPEADMAKVQVGAETEVTLDAYGSDVLFRAKVLSINPSETLLDGVATYKTTFQFVENDERIKSGMTASLLISGERKENVIAVPQRSVITKGQEKYLRVLENNAIVEKQVQTGLRGTDGSIEITSGIVEGERVVVFNEQN